MKKITAVILVSDAVAKGVLEELDLMFEHTFTTEEAVFLEAPLSKPTREEFRAAVDILAESGITRWEGEDKVNAELTKLQKRGTLKA